MATTIKSHRGKSGKSEDKWVRCNAHKRDCPLGEHKTFADAANMSAYNTIEGEFPEFAENSVLFNEVLGPVHDDEYPDVEQQHSGGPKVSDAWGARNRLSEYASAASFGEDITGMMRMTDWKGDTVIDKARSSQSLIWGDEGGGLSSSDKGGGTIHSGFGDIRLHEGWKERFELGTNLPQGKGFAPNTCVVSNGHTVAAIRPVRDKDGKNVKGAFDVRIGTREHPESYMAITMKGDKDGSLSFDGDTYGKALNHAVETLERESPGRYSHDAYIRIDDDRIQAIYKDDYGGTYIENYNDAKSMARLLPKTSEALDKPWLYGDGIKEGGSD